MNWHGGAGKSYAIDTILTTLVKEYDLNEVCYLKLATVVKNLSIWYGYFCR